MTFDQLERGMQLYDAISHNDNLLDSLDKMSAVLSECQPDCGIYIVDKKYELPEEIMKSLIVIAATYYAGVKDKFMSELEEL